MTFMREVTSEEGKDAVFGIDVQSILCNLKFKFNWISCMVYGNLSQVGIYNSFG